MSYVLREYYNGPVLWSAVKNDLGLWEAENCWAACLNGESAKSLFLDDKELTCQADPKTNFMALLNDAGLKDAHEKKMARMIKRLKENKKK